MNESSSTTLGQPSSLDDYDSNDDYSLGDKQKLVVDVLWLVAVLFSIAGSSLLIYVFFGTPPCRRNPKDRFLLGLSAFDIIASLRHGLSVLWHNDETGPICTFEGYFLTLSVSVPLYNMALALYFVATIRYRMTQTQFEKRYERCLHGLAILYPFSIATMGIFFTVYNPSETGRYCFIASYPDGCTNQEAESEKEDMTCTRGQHASVFYYATVGVVPLVCIILIVANHQIYHHVRKLIYQTARYCLSEDPSQKTKMVATQSFLYVAVFLLTWIWTLILLCTEDYYGLIVMEHIFLPLQGAMNFMVYIRPTYMHKRATGMTRKAALQSATFSPWETNTSSNNHPRSRENPPGGTARPPANSMDLHNIQGNLFKDKGGEGPGVEKPLPQAGIHSANGGDPPKCEIIEHVSCGGGDNKTNQTLPL